MLMLNVNQGHNPELMEACHTLWEYAEYTGQMCIRDRSYIYGGCTGEGEVFLGMSEESRKEIIRCAELIKGYPQIPAPDLQFSASSLQAYFSPKEKVQRTQTVTCVGDPANQVTIPLPEGVTPVSYTHLDVYKRQAEVWRMNCPLMIWMSFWARRRRRSRAIWRMTIPSRWTS